VSGVRPGCAVVITLAIVAAIAIPLVWMGRDTPVTSMAGAKKDVPMSEIPKTGTRPGRRVEVTIAVQWTPHGETDECRSDGQWRRTLYGGVSAAEWPADSPESRQLQLVSLRDGLEIEHAEIFTADGHVPPAVVTGQPRGLVRRWRSESPVRAPLRIAACLQSRAAAPQPALRVNTWTRASDESIQSPGR
jgi:hypothetical protein